MPMNKALYPKNYTKFQVMEKLLIAGYKSRYADIEEEQL